MELHSNSFFNTRRLQAVYSRSFPIHKKCIGYFCSFNFYVDDIIVASNDEKAIQKVKDYLNRCFDIKDLGKLKYILGLEIARSSKGIFINQRKYTTELIAEHGFLDCKPCSTLITIDKMDPF